MEITDITGSGFFELTEEQKTQYHNYIWTAVEKTYIQERKVYGHFETLKRLIDQIEWMEENFEEEEDYEMCYLLNKSKIRLQKKYGTKD